MTASMTSSHHRRIWIDFKGGEQMASNRIAGITIEIDGNTTKLTESLKK